MGQRVIPGNEQDIQFRASVGIAAAVGKDVQAQFLEHEVHFEYQAVRPLLTHPQFLDLSLDVQQVVGVAGLGVRPYLDVNGLTQR